MFKILFKSIKIMSLTILLLFLAIYFYGQYLEKNECSECNEVKPVKEMSIDKVSI